MLVAQANSFSQKARLAVTLAWVAGYVNLIGIVVCGRAVSHVTGTVAAFGKDVADGDWAFLGLPAWLVGWFLLGAFASGLATERARAQRWKSIYVLPIALEVFALGSFAMVMALADAPQVEGRASIEGGWLYAATALGCVAMGLQNATITRISGGVVRSTHMTGVVTDLGIELAVLARRRAPARASRPTGSEVPGGLSSGERAALLGALLVSFAFGAALGGIVLAHSLSFAMVPPVLFLSWVIWQDLSQPVGDLDPIEPSAGADAGTWPPNLAVFRLRCAHRRKGRPHRLPNMQHWVESLDPSVDVAVIDLCDADDLEYAGAEELCTVAERMHRAGRSLVLAGVAPGRMPSLHAAGVDRLMPLGSVAPTLEDALPFASERAWRLAVRSASRAGQASAV